MIYRLLPPIVALAAILASGVVHGLWSGRFGPPADLEAAAARLKNVPLVIGDWSGTEQTMNASQLKAAEAVGYISRHYEKVGTGASPEERVALDVTVLCGPTGPMAVHPPTVCFTATGLKQTTSTERMQVVETGTARRHELFDTLFGKDTAGESLRLRTLWSWTGTGLWQAPDSPRFTFAPQPYLYKIYVTRRLEPFAEGDVAPDGESEHDPREEFLEQFLPELNRALFPEPDKG
jgi:hypothetical protein